MFQFGYPPDINIVVCGRFIFIISIVIFTVIFWLSIGPTGIYLFEAQSRIQPNPHFPHTSEATSVVPLVLRHGDVVVMLGRSRLAKHAVPAILFNHVSTGLSPEAYQMASRCGHQLCPDCSNAEFTEEQNHQTCAKCIAITNYLLSTRLNMNVRQVVPYGFRFSDFVL